MMKKFLLATATILSMATIASAQTQTTGFGAKTPLFDAVAGKFNLTANVGYVYNFANDWGGGDVVGKANGGLGYGGRIGWTNNSGFGVSADYLGFASKWKNDFEITNNYHVVTFTPSYRISFGSAKEWGLKLGLGVGFSLADVSWIGNKANATSVSGSRVAGGAGYRSLVAASSLKSGTSCGGGGIIYSDSKTSNIGAVVLGANQCINSAGTAAVAGLTDAEIAAEFDVDTGSSKGKLRIGGTSPTDSVSYAVWRRLFTNAPGSGAFFLYDTANGIYFNAFETRAAYVTRVSETAAAAAETAYTTAAAAACITSKGSGAIVTALGCRSTAEQATDAAAALAATNCINSKGSGALVVNGNCRSVAEQATDAMELAAANCITSKGAGAAIVSGVCRSSTEQVADACIASKGAGALITDGVCKSVAEQAADDVAALALANCITEKGDGSTIVGGQCTAAPVASKAKDDAGFVIAPEISLEYDNGLFHADINARYIHELFHVKYDGQNGAADQLQKSGPLAIFIGAGLGVNF